MLSCKSKIKTHFENSRQPYSSEANWLWGYLRNKEKKLFIQLVKNLEKSKSLDLGAGACEYSEILLTMGTEKAVCVDFSSKIISANRNTKIEKVISDVEEFHTSDQYDLILCLGLLEFLDQPESFLLGLKKFLKAQGRIIILLPVSFMGVFLYRFFYSWKGVSITPFTLRKINQFLIRSNFILEETKRASFFSGFSIYSVRAE